MVGNSPVCELHLTHLRLLWSDSDFISFYRRTYELVPVGARNPEDLDIEDMLQAIQAFILFSSLLRCGADLRTFTHPRRARCQQTRVNHHFGAEAPSEGGQYQGVLCLSECRTQVLRSQDCRILSIFLLGACPPYHSDQETNASDPQWLQPTALQMACTRRSLSMRATFWCNSGSELLSLMAICC